MDINYPAWRIVILEGAEPLGARVVLTHLCKHGCWCAVSVSGWDVPVCVCFTHVSWLRPVAGDLRLNGPGPAHGSSVGLSWR